MILFIYQALSIFTVSLCSNVQDKSPYIARQVKQHPASIEKKCGQSAVIHCILSNGSFSEDLHLVWYRYIAKHQREKIGEINLKTQNMTAANNVQLLWNPDKLSAELRISHLKTSNSGSYGCELVSFNNKMNIKKDQPTNLTVTEEPAHPGRENRTNSNAEKPTGNMMRIEIILAAVISALLIVALLTYITVMYWPKKRIPILGYRYKMPDVRVRIPFPQCIPQTTLY
ncbi:uncharacterized protein LOC103182617 [Callorhinchus milii]|uniref:uncharacterized protein LOC103182617 n=1 Tax=Callorhinchus milii TaxID=7868 RepID=UPI001C3F86D3|nr:uncharacterized protein LOC103182617 [Callorhinchus milii]